MTGAKKVLIVDGDRDLQETLKEQFEVNSEFLTDVVSSGHGAIDKTLEQYYDIILVDARLPDIDGTIACTAMRQNGIKSPIVMLSEIDTDEATILALDAGANDYVIKPFRVNVLMARLRARIRETEQSEHAVFQIGHYSFHPIDKSMHDNRNEQKIRLTEKETAIVKFLYLASDNVVSRDTLLGEVWGYNAGVTTHTLETHVYRLRQKIEEDPSNAVILVTEPTGYRIIR